MLTLRWRDYPRERRIVRDRFRLGLLYPNATVEKRSPAKTATQAKYDKPGTGRRSLAKFSAIRRASSRVKRFVAECRSARRCQRVTVEGIERPETRPGVVGGIHGCSYGIAE
jgi:hypothetical protein